MSYIFIQLVSSNLCEGDNQDIIIAGSKYVIPRDQGKIKTRYKKF